MATLSLFLVSPLSITITRLIPALTETSLYSIHTVPLDQDLIPLFVETRPCICVFSMSDKQSARGVSAFLQQLKVFREKRNQPLRDPSVRIVLIVEDRSVHFERWQPVGMHETLFTPATQKTLIFKLGRHCHKALYAEPVFTNPEASNSYRWIRSPQPKPKESYRLDLKKKIKADETEYGLNNSFLATFKPTNEDKQINRMVITTSSTAFNPEEGDWQPDPNSNVFEEQWTFVQKKDLIPGAPDGWSYTGDKPKYNPQTKKWSFTGESPKLIHNTKENGGQPLFSQSTKDPYGITVKENSKLNIDSVEIELFGKFEKIIPAELKYVDDIATQLEKERLKPSQTVHPTKTPTLSDPQNPTQKSKSEETTIFDRTRITPHSKNEKPNPFSPSNPLPKGEQPILPNNKDSDTASTSNQKFFPNSKSKPESDLAGNIQDKSLDTKSKTSKPETTGPQRLEKEKPLFTNEKSHSIEPAALSHTEFSASSRSKENESKLIEEKNNTTTNQEPPALKSQSRLEKEAQFNGLSESQAHKKKNQSTPERPASDQSESDPSGITSTNWKAYGSVFNSLIGPSDDSSNAGAKTSLSNTKPEHDFNKLNPSNAKSPQDDIIKFGASDQENSTLSFHDLDEIAKRKKEKKVNPEDQTIPNVSSSTLGGMAPTSKLKTNPSLPLNSINFDSSTLIKPDKNKNLLSSLFEQFLKWIKGA